MLGFGRPDRHALPRITPSKRAAAKAAPSRESGFVLRPFSDLSCRAVAMPADAPKATSDCIRDCFRDNVYPGLNLGPHRGAHESL